MRYYVCQGKNASVKTGFFFFLFFFLCKISQFIKKTKYILEPDFALNFRSLNYWGSEKDSWAEVAQQNTNNVFKKPTNTDINAEIIGFSLFYHNSHAFPGTLRVQMHSTENFSTFSTFVWIYENPRDDVRTVCVCHFRRYTLQFFLERGAVKRVTLARAQ